MKGFHKKVHPVMSLASFGRTVSDRGHYDHSLAAQLRSGGPTNQTHVKSVVNCAAAAHTSHCRLTPTVKRL
jgi:hypothetical protein